MMVNVAWYRGPANAQPAKPPREDETWVGVSIPGQMTDGQRLRAAIGYADEQGYDTSVVMVGAPYLERYILLRAAVGHMVMASGRDLRETEFVFRDARRDGVVGVAMRSEEV